MENLNREAILRMLSGKTGNSSSGGGGGGIDLAGYATSIWVTENFVSIDFFRELFKAYDSNGNEVMPNDTETTIDNIKAMFGFWTDFYISALGTGGQSTVGLRLAQLADVNVSGVTNGQVLTYDSTAGKWIASTPQSGTDMATVWANLAAVDATKQIDYSHLSGAISLSQGTITIGSNSITPITSHQSLAGYATQTWVGQNYLPLTGGSLSGTLQVTNEIWINSSGTPRLIFHIPNVNWGNIALSSGGEFYLYKTNTSSGGWANVNVGEVYADGWLITYGARGWYNQSYGGGWYMEDSTWIRSYGSKYVWVDSYLCAAHITAGSSTADSNYALRVDGVGYFTSGVYSAGYVTALSDERKKDIVGDVNLTVEQIASARTVMFRWKDNRDNDLHVGSIAQDWQKILPQEVFEKDGELSMDYSVIALMCGITIARKVEDHESRLKRLEKENEELKLKLKIA